MALIVQKFGGSSVADIDRIRNVANRVAEYRHRGDQVVVVVSAMRGVTDNLIDMAKSLMPVPSEREMDMLLATGEQTTVALLAIALQSMDIPAASLTGAQAGIVTDSVHSKAKIRNITPKKIHAMLDAGNVTSDPRIVPTAKKLEEVSYDEMLELASLGAKVMQSRSVEFAKKFGVLFEVRSSLNDNPGTLVKEETKSMEDVVIRGVSLDKNQAKVTLVGVPDKPGMAARVFQQLADSAINVDMIVQNVSHGSDTPSTDLSFTIDKPDVAKAQGVIDGMRGDISFGEALTDENIGKLSIVGVGMRSHSGIAAKVFEVLAAAGVNIQMISTSEIKISVVIGIDKAEEATRAVHDAFLG
jgi:aspartate kinase